MDASDAPRPTTLGALRASPWAEHAGRSVRDEVRANLRARLAQGGPVFPGIVGYDRTVVPGIVNALLAKHDLILLGTRGQAKTRLLRAIADLLDDAQPVLADAELPDDPLAPTTREGRDLVAAHGDDAAIAWRPRAERYVEKLATPDVTVADLVGDVDPIKASRLGTKLGDERAVHYGLLPRAHRGIFAVNELPDLAGKVQVALFNVMQEGDVQIRGYPVRLPLDVLTVFSANPEDYTARGRIVTPLKDRIGSEVRTHDPDTVDAGLRITLQEAWTARGGDLELPAWVAEAVERTAFRAREDARVDDHAGVSQRLPISLLETVVSNAERRAWAHGRDRAVARVRDLEGGLAAVTGKLELAYEGELRGAEAVARDVMRDAVGATFDAHAGDVDVASVVDFFEGDAVLRLPDDDVDARLAAMAAVPGLLDAADALLADAAADAELRDAAAEFVLEGLVAKKRIARSEERGYEKAEPDARSAAFARTRWN